MDKSLSLVIGMVVLAVAAFTVMSLTSSSLSVLGDSQESISSRCSVQLRQLESGAIDREDVSEECINTVENDERRGRLIAESAGVPIID